MRTLKVCLISTTGGHLVQIQMLRDAFEPHDHYFVTVDSDFSRELLRGERAYYITQILREPARFILNSYKALGILRKERPDAIVTTGAGDVLPTCFLGKSMGSRIVFLETFARVREPSLVGRFLAPIADLVLVQWKPMLQHYGKAVYSGPIYRAEEFQEIPERPRVFIVTGTHTASFHRLVQGVDDLVGRGEMSVGMAQIGHSTYEPRNYPWKRFMPFDEFLAELEKSDIVLTHDGASSIGLALSHGKRVVVVPRRKEFGEVEYASKQDLARYLADMNLITLVDDVIDAPAGLSRVDRILPGEKAGSETGPVNLIREYLAGL